MTVKPLHEPQTDDPILSVVELIDIFLVIIAALLITVAQNPLMNPFSKRDVTVITDPGKPNMEIVVNQRREGRALQGQRQHRPRRR